MKLHTIILTALLSAGASAQIPLLFSNNGWQVTPHQVVVNLNAPGTLPTTTLDLFSNPGPFEVFAVPVPPLAAAIVIPEGLVWLDPMAAPVLAFSGVSAGGFVTIMTFSTAALPPGLDMTFQAVVEGGVLVSTSLHLRT